MIAYCSAVMCCSCLGAIGAHNGSEKPGAIEFCLFCIGATMFLVLAITGGLIFFHHDSSALCTHNLWAWGLGLTIYFIVAWCGTSGGSKKAADKD
jgi:hypothetical protein